MDTLIRFFRITAAFILGVTGIAKIWSALGSVAILKNADPIFGLKFTYLMVLAGGIEVLVALICSMGKSGSWAVGSVACISTEILLYRMGLWWIDWRRPCSCLGNLTDALHIAPQTADTAMKIILAYLLLGSYATLFWLWRQKRKAVSAAAQTGPAAPAPAP